MYSLTYVVVDNSKEIKNKVVHQSVVLYMKGYTTKEKIVKLNVVYFTDNKSM